MKSKLILIIAALLLTACEGIPVNVSYTGAAAGHEFTAAYGNKSGFAAVVNQK
jgi:hypothetical protein